MNDLLHKKKKKKQKMKVKSCRNICGHLSVHSHEIKRTFLSFPLLLFSMCTCCGKQTSLVFFNVENFKGPMKFYFILFEYKTNDAFSTASLSCDPITNIYSSITTLDKKGHKAFINSFIYLFQPIVVHLICDTTGN